MPSLVAFRRLGAAVLEIALGVFLVALFVSSRAGSHALADPDIAAEFTEAAGHSPLAALTPGQGTTLITKVIGSITGSDATFGGQRHFISGTPGEVNCVRSGVIGPRSYDVVNFINTTNVAQSVSIDFVSGCGNNTYAAAYSPAFDPSDICANYLAGAGRSGSLIWRFTVCANSSFSIVVYGREPGVTCGSYAYYIYAVGIAPLGPIEDEPVAATKMDDRGFPDADTTIKRLKGDPFTDSKTRIVMKETGTSTAGVLPLQGTPLVATVTDSLSSSDTIAIGFAHFRSGIPGDRNCQFFTNPLAARQYDEYFFRNESASIQKVSVSFTTSCGSNPYMAAYSAMFNPSRICENYIAGAGLSGNVNWDFTVCPNTEFSLVVYGLVPGLACPQYTFSVFASGTVFLGTLADVVVSKAAPSGPVSVGSLLNYTFTVSNFGPGRANNIVFTDPLPPGTTFALLSAPGTALPPSCETPPVGSGGTVTCNLNLDPPSGTPVAPVTFMIGVNVTSGAGSSLVNTATVTRLGIDPNPANNSSTVITAVNNPFNTCIQDDSTGNILRFNSTTGEYQFQDCVKGITLSGRGTLVRTACTVELEDNGPDPKRPDRRIRASVSTCTQRASASVFIVSSNKTFDIADTSILDNSCQCR